MTIFVLATNHAGRGKEEAGKVSEDRSRNRRRRPYSAMVKTWLWWEANSLSLGVIENY
jgi:hypothetical protein